MTGLETHQLGPVWTARSKWPKPPSLLAARPGWWPWVPAIACAAATAGCVTISRGLPPKGQGGDPGWFVLDEAAGVWLAAAALPQPTWTGLAAAFALFRVFDIFKPPPVRALERAGGGWGIVLDDLMAGVYALLILLAWETWMAT